MELAGNEKRIQALFSELSHAEAQVAPDFGKLWREALVAEQVPRFGKSLVLKVATAATVIVAVTVLFVLWSRDRAPIEQTVQNVAPQTLPDSSQVQAPEPANKVVQRRSPSPSHRRRTLARRQQRGRALDQQAALLANWRSPTEQFMTAPTASAFSSLPQLNESVKDLQSFLPKESNQ
jgi:hypothetical protein